jgi:hypothetical protein
MSIFFFSIDLINLMFACDNTIMEFLSIHSLDSFTINPKEKSTLENKEDVIAIYFGIQSLSQCKDFTLGVIYTHIACKFHIKGQNFRSNYK